MRSGKTLIAEVEDRAEFRRKTDVIEPGNVSRVKAARVNPNPTKMLPSLLNLSDVAGRRGFDKARRPQIDGL